MIVSELSLPGVLLLVPPVYPDERGDFREVWSAKRYRALGLEHPFVQENQTRSRRGVIRGLHFQHPASQGKLVRVVSGAVFDVVVDVRTSSPNFGEWLSHTLSARVGDQLFVPRGFAHGFQALEEDTLVCYSCDGMYAPEHQHAIRYDDQQLAIPWPIAEMIVSDRDRAGHTLAEMESLDILPPLEA